MSVALAIPASFPEVSLPAAPHLRASRLDPLIAALPHKAANIVALPRAVTSRAFAVPLRHGLYCLLALAIDVALGILIASAVFHAPGALA